MKILEMYESTVIAKSCFDSEEEMRNYEHWEDGNFDDSYEHGERVGGLDAASIFINYLNAIGTDSAKESLLALGELQSLIGKKIKDINSHVESEFKSGNLVEGFVVKQGRTSRAIKSEGDVTAALDGIVSSEELFESKMIGIPAIEKLLTAKKIKSAERKEIMSKFVIEKEGKSSLVIADE